MAEDAFNEDFLSEESFNDGIFIFIFNTTIKIDKYIAQINILGKKRIMIFY